MADDTEYVKVKSPTGSITIVPVELKDALLSSGYKVSRQAAHTDDQSGSR